MIAPWMLKVLLVRVLSVPFGILRNFRGSLPPTPTTLWKLKMCAPPSPPPHKNSSGRLCFNLLLKETVVSRSHCLLY